MRRQSKGDIRSFFGGAGKAKAEAGAAKAEAEAEAEAAPPAKREDEKRKRAAPVVVDDDDDDFAPPPAKSPRKTPTPGKPEASASKSRSAKKSEKEAEPMEVQRARAAARALPKLTEDEDYRLLEEGVTAAAHGGGAAPLSGGKPNVTPAMFVGDGLCLAGMSFVLTGTGMYLDRDALADVIKRHGGKVAQSVSGRTSFLVVGPAEVGPRKTQVASEKGVPLINEDGLLAMLQGSYEGGAAAAAKAVRAKAEAAAAPAAPPRPAAPTARDKGKAPLRPPPRSDGANAGELWTVRHKPKSLEDLVGNSGHIQIAKTWLQNWFDVHLHGKAPPKPPGQSARSQRVDMSKKALMLSGPPGCGKTSTAVCLLNDLGYSFTEVNASDTRGTSAKDVKDGVGKLSTKLREMVTNQNLFSRGFGSGAESAKSALILDEVDGMSGNADRGGVAEVIQMIKSSKIPIICICNDKYNQKLKSLRNHCIELDYSKPTRPMVVKRIREIARREGLHIEDNALEVMAESCNGDLRMVINQIQLLAQNQAGAGGGRKDTFTYDEVKARAGKTEKDIGLSPFEATSRLFAGPSAATNHNFFGGTQGPTQTQTQGGGGSAASGAAGLSQDASQAVAAQGFPTNVNPLLDLCFHDADLIPLLVHENYLNHFSKFSGNPRMPGDIAHSLVQFNPRINKFFVKVPRKTGMALMKPVAVPMKAMEAARMDLIAGASEFLSLSDVAWSTVRGGRGGNQHWSLMPFAALAGCVAPASFFCRGGREMLYDKDPTFNRFPAYLGNLSSGNKWRRVLRTMRTTMCASAAHITATATSTRLDYLPALRTLLPLPIKQKEKEGAPDVVAMLREYSLSPEDWESLSEITSFETKMSWGVDPRSAIAAPTKAAVTRLYNAHDGRVHGGAVLDPTALFSRVGEKKGGKRKRGAAAMGGAKSDTGPKRRAVLGDDEGDALEEEGDDEGDALEEEGDDDEEEAYVLE